MPESSNRPAKDKIPVNLTAAQRALLVTGTWLWFDGPNHSDNSTTAAMMGLKDGQRVSAELRRISGLLVAEEPLTSGDWARALLATEIGFASRIYGSVNDWVNVTGADEVQTFLLLREVQFALSDALPRRFPERDYVAP